MPKFRKDEFKFYMNATPSEISQYVKNHPENEDYIEQFLNNYRYNYIQKIWRPINK